MSSIHNNPTLFFQLPTLHSTKGDSHLLVWGESASWIVIDTEAYQLLKRFDGKKSIGRIIVEHAAQYKIKPEHVAQQASGLIDECLRRKILSSSSRKFEVGDEPVEIANITLNLTNRCNLKCAFCYNEVRKGREVTASEVISFLKKGKGVLSKDASLIVLGGEPFFRPQALFDLIDYSADELTLALMVSTNGTLITDDIVTSLSKRKVDVQISLDSYLQKKHDALRGKGVFEKAVDAAKRLVEAKVHTILSMVYDANNIDEMESYLDLALSLNVDEARFIPLRNAGAAVKHDPSARPNQIKVFEHLLGILERRPNVRRLLKRDFFSIAMIKCRSSSSSISCGIGRRVIFLDADGSIYPCPNHVSDIYKLGNIIENTLSEILHHTKRMQEIRDKYRIDRYTKCAKCAFRRWCAGDCRGEVLSVTGDPLAPSVHCSELKKMYTRILWLIAAGDSRVPGFDPQTGGKDAKDVFFT